MDYVLDLRGNCYGELLFSPFRTQLKQCICFVSLARQEEVLDVLRKTYLTICLIFIFSSHTTNNVSLFTVKRKNTGIKKTGFKY